MSEDFSVEKLRNGVIVSEDPYGKKETRYILQSNQEVLDALSRWLNKKPEEK